MRRWLLAVLACAALTARADEPRECVVLLHGVGMGRWTMIPLARALEAAGYRTVNLSYPSRTLDVERIAGEWLPERLRAAGLDRAPRVHFVAHSMGSLVTRLYLRDHRPANLGRVVMLGPPNHGSVAADHAERNGFYRWLLGVNLARLGTGPGGVAPRLPAPDYEVGVIADTERVNPLFAAVLSGEHDGVVTLESARLEGMRDFLVVPHSHTGMLWRAGVQAQVATFLRAGHFTR